MVVLCSRLKPAIFARVLTMEFVEGVHVDEFLKTNPPQHVRNEFAEKMMRAWSQRKK